MDFKALTKIQTAALILTIVIVAVAGGAAYVMWGGPAQSTEDIRIGVCTDLDMNWGKAMWQGVVLAAEQVNAEGGVLGRNLTVVAEDDDSLTSSDIAVGINALTRLLTVDRADYVISLGGLNIMAYQDKCCEHKKIFLGTAGLDAYSQRVLDNYEKYKYSFSLIMNDTAIAALKLGEVIGVGEYTGFTKVALLFDDMPLGKAVAAGLSKSLPDYGLEVVYSELYPFATTDFTSYLAAIEASGAEILVPWVLAGGEIALVKEWCDRESPFIVWGNLGVATLNSFWALTEGKCDTVCFSGSPVIAGYPLTSKTMPFREAYLQRWSEIPNEVAVWHYDALRNILAHAIEHAGTTETEAVVKALEKTDVETTSVRHFVFTSSHDLLVEFESPTTPSEKYSLNYYFQWQNGTQVPVYPSSLMEEAGATYKYPPWQGPWRK